MQNTENKILIDWISFTSKVDSVSSIIDLLGLGSLTFTECNGAQGYANRVAYDGINIHYNHRINQGIWVEMSGKGCRAFETFSEVDFIFLFELLLVNDKAYNITRLDVAYDCFDKKIPIQQFARDVLNKRYVTRFSDKSMLVTCAAGRVGYTIDCGSRKSDIRFRCYDKAYERGYLETDPDYKPWIRFEIQLRDERATSFLDQLDYDNVGELFRGVVSNYMRILKPSSDSNKSRWPSKKWWSEFIGDVEKISLFSKCDVEYNLAKCEDYVYHQCGNALDALLKIKGIETVLNELRVNKPETTEKYKKLINDNSGSGVIDYISEMENRRK